MIWGSWLFVLILLIAIAFATGSDEREPAPPSGALRAVAPVDAIARRVEDIRGLRFKRVPEPVRVTPAQARREGLEALDREYPPRRRRADEAVLRLLGLVTEDLDLRDAASTIFETQVAGYYDTEKKRLRVVEGPGSSGRAYAEIILAHELTHALEDQRFRLDFDDLSGLDDRTLAYGALVEGTASALMYEYAERHFTAEEFLVGILGSAFVPPPDLPAFIQAQLVFPYVRGEEFAQRLYSAAGDRWTLIDIAHRRRPPVSSEQVLHPDSYLRFEDPLPVRVRAREALGRGWRRTNAGTLGEWQTSQLLLTAGGTGANDAAQGWGGDRFELWSGPDGDAVVVRWRWDSGRDRREFEAKLRAYLEEGSPGGEAAMASTGGAVTLAVAQDAATARRLARAGD